SASAPSGAETVKVSPHAQEMDRVPAAGVSKGRLDLVGGVGRRATRLPQESIGARLRRSAQLVGFARRPGNQQFASNDSSEGFSSVRAGSSCARAIKRSRSGPWRRRALRDQVPDVAIVCSTLGNARPLLPQFGAALSARAGLGSIPILLARVIPSSV